MRALLVAIVLSLSAPVVAAADDHCDRSDALGCGVGDVVATDADFRGAIVVPGSEAANRAVADSGGCEGCEWTLVRQCDLNAPHDPGYVSCLAARCPDGDAYRLYLKRPGDVAPVFLDTLCLNDSRRVVTAAELAVDVERHVTRLVPNAHAVQVQAPGFAVVNVPAFFAAAGPESEQRTLDVGTAAGRARLRIDVGPTEYTWTFGDGATCTTQTRGGPWDGDRSGTDRCDTRVAHRYTSAGTATVSLAVRWTGTYEFDVGYGAVGPLAIPGDGVATESQRLVQVREARAELVGKP